MTCKLALLLGGVTPIIPMILTGMTAPLAPDLKGALMKAKPSSQACAALMVSYHFAIAAWNDQIRSAAADQLCWLDDCAYDCRSRTPRFLASRVSPLIAACKSFASVGKVMSLGCAVVSTVTRAKSFVRSAPLSCATLLSSFAPSQMPRIHLCQA